MRASFGFGRAIASAALSLLLLGQANADESQYSSNITIVGDAGFVSAWTNALDRDSAIFPDLRAQIDAQAANGHSISIVQVSDGLGNRVVPADAQAAQIQIDGEGNLVPGEGSSATFYFDTSATPTFADGTACYSPLAATGAHEIFAHALDDMEGMNASAFTLNGYDGTIASITTPGAIDMEEQHAMDLENQARAAIG